MSLNTNRRVDIHGLVVGKCYKLTTNFLQPEYLGILSKEPSVMGSGNGRVNTALFDNNGKIRSIEEWTRYNSKRKNYFIEVPCQTSGGRRRSRKSRQKRRRTHKRR